MCANTTGKNAKSVVLKTQGSGSLKDNVITVFGMNTFTCLEPVEVSISDSYTVNGFLSKPGYGSGRNLGDRQFFFVNGRPVDMPKVSKLVNELYRGANSRQYPIAIINFTVPARAYDVNVTPDKRKIFFSDEVCILRSLREALEKIYSPNHASYSVHKFEEPTKKVCTSKSYSQQENSQLQTRQSSQNDSSREACQQKQFSDAGTPLTAEKEYINDVPVVEVMDSNLDRSAGKDFMLRVHSFKKEDTFTRSSLKKLKDRDSATENQPLQLNSSPLQKSGDGNLSSQNRSIFQSSLNKFVTMTKRKHESMALSEVPVLRNRPILCQSREPEFDKCSTLSKSAVHMSINDSKEDNNDEPHTSELSRVDKVSSETDMPVSGGKQNGEQIEVCLSDNSFLQHFPVFLFPLGKKNVLRLKHIETHSSFPVNERIFLNFFVYFTLSRICIAYKALPNCLINLGNIFNVKQFDFQQLKVEERLLPISTGCNVEHMSEDLLHETIKLQSTSSDPSSDSPISCGKVGSTLQFSFKELVSRRGQRLAIFHSISDTSGMKKIRGYQNCKIFIYDL